MTPQERAAIAKVMGWTVADEITGLPDGFTRGAAWYDITDPRTSFAVEQEMLKRGWKIDLGHDLTQIYQYANKQLEGYTEGVAEGTDPLARLTAAARALLAEQEGGE